MKLIAQYFYLDEAIDTQFQLRKSDVATYISSARSFLFSSSKTGVLKVGLWVLLDRQFEDATQLLKNPGHTPSFILSDEEIVKLEEKINKTPNFINLSVLESAAAWILGLVITGFVLFIIYSFMTSS